MNAPCPKPQRRSSAFSLRLRMLLVLTALTLASLAGAYAAPAAQPAALVKEINVAQRRFDYGIGGLVPAGSQAFFKGWDPENGRELWVTNGTAAGTRLVYDLAAGASDLSLGEMVSAGNRLFFQRWDSESGTGLWVTDGTASGTAQLSNNFPEQLTDVNGILFFTYSNGLWKSDGTAAGTTKIRDFGDWPAPTNLTNAAGKLFFVAGDPAYGRELWVSDGTSAGTKMVADLNPNGDAFSQWSSTDLAAVGGILYFIPSEAPLAGQLWRSDGTSAGTRRLTSAGAIELAGAEELENVAGTLYFHGIGHVSGPTWSTGLWKSDGSPAGTVEIKSFSPITDTLDTPPAHLVAAGSRLFFAGPNATLWTSDGSPSGTIQLGTVQISADAFAGTADASGRLFFTGADATGDVELWSSDGTLAGTQRVKDINPNASSSPGSPTRLGNAILFGANNGQLWRSDGTAAGTTLLRDLSTAPLGIYWYPSGRDVAYPMAEGLGKLFFSADDGTHGNELWVSDGSAAGTKLVKDINPAGSSMPLFITPLGGAVYFMTGNETSFVLWRTDGSDAGTSAIKSFDNARIPAGGGMIKVGAALYFLARDTDGDKLWRSDGTPNGTAPILTLTPASQPPDALIGVNGQLYFVATDDAHGRELWTSDGTTSGTKIARDILSGPYGSDPFGLSKVGGALFFMAWGGQDYELWKSVGAGSVARIKALGLGNIDPSWEPDNFTVAGDRLFFTTGLQMLTRPELWASDGSAAGTGPVILGNGRGIPDPSNLAGVNGRLLFSWNDGVHGHELWASDGTTAGTQLLKDINSGPASSALNNIRQVRDDGWALFAASAGPDGIELWQTDGTPTHTQQVQDLAPGAQSSNPVNFVGAGSRIYFVADDSSTGPELWSLNRAMFADLFKAKLYLPVLRK